MLRRGLGLASTKSLVPGEAQALPQFVAMRDVRASNAGLLARPGSKVWYLDGGRCRHYQKLAAQVED